MTLFLYHYFILDTRLVERAKEDSFMFMFKSYTLITSKFTFFFFFVDADMSS